MYTRSIQEVPKCLQEKKEKTKGQDQVHFKQYIDIYIYISRKRQQDNIPLERKIKGKKSQ